MSWKARLEAICTWSKLEPKKSHPKVAYARLQRRFHMVSRVGPVPDLRFPLRDMPHG